VSRNRLPLAVTLGVLVFFYLPIAVLVAQSFNASRYGGRWEGFTLAWYARLLGEREIWRALRNSLLVASTVTLASVVLGLLMGFGKMSANSETDAFMASGIGLNRMARPVIVLGALMAALSLLIMGWVQPHARYAYRSVVFDVQNVEGFYLAEDEVLGHGNGPKPLRFAIPVVAGIDITDGEWLNVEGGRLWRTLISSPNATTARLHLTGLQVPAGQQVRMSAPGWESTTIGPIEGVGEFGTGEAWSMSLPTNEVLLEWFVPTGARVKALPFRGVEYYHGYRQIWKLEGPLDGGIAAAGTCHLDPICFPTWANGSNGTVRLIFGGFVMGYLVIPAVERAIEWMKSVHLIGGSDDDTI